MRQAAAVMSPEEGRSTEPCAAAAAAIMATIFKESSTLVARPALSSTPPPPLRFNPCVDFPPCVAKGLGGCSGGERTLGEWREGRREGRGGAIVTQQPRLQA